MNDPIVLQIEVRYDGNAVAHDLTLNREVTPADLDFLSTVVADKIAPLVRSLQKSRS